MEDIDVGILIPLSQTIFVSLGALSNSNSFDQVKIGISSNVIETDLILRLTDN